MDKTKTMTTENDFDDNEDKQDNDIYLVFEHIFHSNGIDQQYIVVEFDMDHDKRFVEVDSKRENCRDDTD